MYMHTKGFVPSLIPDGYSDREGADWDTALQRLGGDFLQSWRWGEFKSSHGWSAERVQVRTPSGMGMAQVLFRRRGGITLAYIPRGPAMDKGGAVASELLAGIDEVCARQRVVVLVVEPNQPLPSFWTHEDGRFSSGPASFQASRTVKVRLTPEADLLAQMRKDTRYNISYAQRNGMLVERAPVESPAITTFYRLLQDTSQRNGFRIHSYSYYEDFLRILGDEAILLFSRVEGVVTAGLIAARCGSEARSMYAGSATEHRSRGDTALLRLEAMRWARDHGCAVFDLGGIAAEAPVSPIAEHEKSGSDLDGVRQFKVGFGGEIVTYPATVERRYRPGLAWVVRRFHSRFRTAAPG